MLPPPPDFAIGKPQKTGKNVSFIGRRRTFLGFVQFFILRMSAPQIGRFVRFVIGEVFISLRGTWLDVVQFFISWMFAPLIGRNVQFVI